MRAVKASDHTFLDTLGPDSVVLDLGMFRGEFAEGIARRYGCRVVGAEPVPHLARALDGIAGVTVEPLAVTADGAPVELHLSEGRCATVTPGMRAATTQAIQVEGATLEGLVARHRLAAIDLVKMDIEGAELGVLLGAPQSLLENIGQLTIEFHDWLDAAQREPAARVARRLHDSGFARIDFSTNNTDVLFVNTAVHSLSAAQRLWLTARYKYARGVARILRRATGR